MGPGQNKQPRMQNIYRLQVHQKASMGGTEKMAHHLQVQNQEKSKSMGTEKEMGANGWMNFHGSVKK
jgi:hypothetical protein